MCALVACHLFCNLGLIGGIEYNTSCWWNGSGYTTTSRLMGMIQHGKARQNDKSNIAQPGPDKVALSPQMVN